MTAALERRLDRGEAWFDLVLPGTWYWAVDPDLLNMSHGEQCMLGQTAEQLLKLAGKKGTFFDYAEVATAYRTAPFVSSWGWASAHGFNVQLSGDKVEEWAKFRELTDAWRARVRRRRAADKPNCDTRTMYAGELTLYS